LDSYAVESLKNPIMPLSSWGQDLSTRKKPTTKTNKFTSRTEKAEKRSYR